MELINMKSLLERQANIKADYQSKKPFRYVMFENFFSTEPAELIYQNYPLFKTANGTGQHIWIKKTNSKKRNSKRIPSWITF